MYRQPLTALTPLFRQSPTQWLQQIALLRREINAGLAGGIIVDTPDPQRPGQLIARHVIQPDGDVLFMVNTHQLNNQIALEQHLATVAIRLGALQEALITGQGCLQLIRLGIPVVGMVGGIAYVWWQPITASGLLWPLIGSTIGGVVGAVVSRLLRWGFSLWLRGFSRQ